MEIEKLRLSPRARNALRRANINTVEELQALTGEELLAIRGIGTVLWYEIREALYERMKEEAEK